MENKQKKTPIMLIILDGLGYRKEKKGNAVYAAKMPNFKSWLKEYPYCLLKASGKAVGLLPNNIGNSEVGHLTIGAGRIIKSALVKFKESIDDKSLFKNEILIKNFKKLSSKNSLHLMGLLSDGGVHSHEFQVYALLDFAKQQGIKDVYLHLFLDGRDVPPRSACKYLRRLEQKIKEVNLGEIASIHGRFYAMDRDKNWGRTKVSYDVLCNPDIKTTNQTWGKFLENSYSHDITDEFIYPTLFLKDGQIKKGDGVIFFNFRPDRARQLTQTFIDPNFDEFETQNLNSTNKTLSFFITTTRYKEEFKKFNNDMLFEDEKIKNTLLDVIPYKKFIIAETEKYAHVTYFFRGMADKKLENEQRVLIPSIKAKNYIDHPEMSAKKITDKVIESLQNDPADFYLINYANPDMVGHSGDFDATVKACEFLDKELERLYDTVIEKDNGTMFITADHGNAEEMIDLNTGVPKTAHTNNPVYFLTVNKNFKDKSFECDKFGLSNIAPTILQFLNLKIPKEMIDKVLM
ncbi:2,3-bisphosphoglycerate-independent phosphoglycerate mutase [Candidatus Dependentiae bacterium]|nr:2,3-bisphosphoglycerate-independent phosphoglycerate mutase [Candidatus Dependentiae bacterium]